MHGLGMPGASIHSASTAGLQLTLMRRTDGIRMGNQADSRRQKLLRNKSPLEWQFAICDYHATRLLGG